MNKAKVQNALRTGRGGLTRARLGAHWGAGSDRGVDEDLKKSLMTREGVDRRRVIIVQAK